MIVVDPLEHLPPEVYSCISFDNDEGEEFLTVGRCDNPLTEGARFLLTIKYTDSTIRFGMDMETIELIYEAMKTLEEANEQSDT